MLPAGPPSLFLEGARAGDSVCVCVSVLSRCYRRQSPQKLFNRAAAFRSSTRSTASLYDGSQCAEIEPGKPAISVFMAKLWNSRRTRLLVLGRVLWMRPRVR
jgi:hypothetical protein